MTDSKDDWLPRRLEKSVKVAPAKIDFKRILEQTYLDHARSEAITSANMLIVPATSFRGKEGPAYPVGSEDLYLYLRQQSDPDVRVEVPIRDAEYQEYALHTDVVTIATILTTAGIALKALDLVDRWLQRRRRGRIEDTDVRFELLVEDRGRGTAVSIRYEGPVTEFRATMKSAVKELGAPDNGDDD